MIIPKVSASQFAATRANQVLDSIIHQLRHWSLFGTVALADVQQLSVVELESIARKTGGLVDLEIELPQVDGDRDASALALLNAGASKIIGSARDAQSLSSVPTECWLILKTSSDSQLSAGDQTELTKPTAKKLAEFEQQRVDVLVDSKQLAEQPELIADFFKHILVSDRPDGLWSTIIVDPLGLALGLTYSNYESLLDAITNRRGTYWSRSRGGLWIKGATSGATQQLLDIRIDCDRDCLRFKVTQDPPGFCHRATHSCFGSERTMQAVLERLCERVQSSDEKSFTKKLVNDPEMLRKKLLEEACELAEAETPDHIAFEAADVLYFSLVKMLSADVRLETVQEELARRMTRVVRRPNKLEEGV